MANYPKITLTADTTGTLLCSVKPKGMDGLDYKITIQATGDFGSGTLSFLANIDNDITAVADMPELKDISGVVYSITSKDFFTATIPLNMSTQSGAELEIYAVLSGSTSPDIDIVAIDNF